MQIFLGDRITLLKGDTFVTGQCSGVVLSDSREIYQLFIHGIVVPFQFPYWRVVEEDETEYIDDEEEE